MCEKKNKSVKYDKIVCVKNRKWENPSVTKGGRHTGRETERAVSQSS